MRITICHLSDIHFAVDGNTILEKQEKLCNAILQDALKKEVIIFHRVRRYCAVRTSGRI